ncbi:MAG: cyanophycinase [Cryobacterium sp.]|nr:cyanophycinase [Oligoflexia bacterium]
MQTFFEWTGRPAESTVLVIAWASEEVRNTVAYYLELFTGAGFKVEVSASAPITYSERIDFIEQLSRADGVFFTGGDQNRTAAGFDFKDVKLALQTAYTNGTPFAGTSAGTAIMSMLMFTGKDDPEKLDEENLHLREGLGFVPGVIFDQHFIKRMRQNRLFSAILHHPNLIGLGIDEGTGLEILDGKYCKVVGPEKVMRVAKQGSKRSLDVEIYHEGESFELLPAKSSSTQQAS